MRVWIVTVAVLVSLLLGALWYGSAQHTRAVNAEGQVDVLAGQLAVSKARTARIQKAVQKVETERDEAQAGMRAALAASKEWADSPAPAAVSDELCKRLRCTGVRPVPTPVR